MGPAAPFALADLVKAEVGVGLDKLQSGVRISQQCEQVVFHWLSGRSAIDPQLRFAERLAGRKGDAETPAWLIGEPKSGGLEGKIKTAALHPNQRNQRSNRSLCIAWLRQTRSEELGSLEHRAEQVGLFEVRQSTQAVIIAEQHSKVTQNMPVEQALRKPGRRRIGRAGKIFPGLVIGITASSLGGISRHDLPLVPIDEQTNQQRVLPVVPRPLAWRSLLFELHLDALPQILVHNRFMLSVMGFALVDDLTPVNRILEQVEQAAPPERDATAMGTAHSTLHLSDDAFRSKLLEQSRHRPGIEVASHDRPDPQLPNVWSLVIVVPSISDSALERPDCLINLIVLRP